jgi:hypothetical protein
MKYSRKRWSGLVMAGLFNAWAIEPGHAYTFNEIVPDVRQPASVSGGSACPVRSHMRSPGSVTLRWSTSLGTNPAAIITQEQGADGHLDEIEAVVTQSLGAWSGVTGTTIHSMAQNSVSRTATQNACGTDGINSVCFNQADMAFTPGVLAFTRVIVADKIGVQSGSGAASIEPGEILDADIYFNPSDFRTSYATPQALSAASASYDLESLLTHEMGHLLGFSHSAVWNAIMFPFAPAPGTFAGSRPTLEEPDAPLGEDDRTGLRVLYPDQADILHGGSIQGRIMPANPLALVDSHPGVTGLFGTHVVAVDADTGGVVGATMGGWSCSGTGPTKFDGAYTLERLAIGGNYQVYAEPLNGVVDPSQIANATSSLCRNSTTDAGWPALQNCVVPAIEISFTTRIRPGP